MELSPDHVVLPREDFLELQEAAMVTGPMSGRERAESVLQTTAIFAGISVAFAVASWSWVKSKDWLEERNFQRRVRSGEVNDSNHSHKQH